jgi:HD superfamily phosphohydrolase YqeK
MHPVVDRAGSAAELPDWAHCGKGRRAHGVRVGDLLQTWAARLDLPESEQVRWRAAGVLHDALKDAPLAELRELAAGDWPGPVVHAPACADRLAADGVEDMALLDAIRYHPVGHPALDELGEFLILADYLEPGRVGSVAKRNRLRGRLPDDRRKVLTIVVRQRFDRLLKKKRPLMGCSVDFWNRLVAG